MRTIKNTPEPRIYAACLAAYNNGRLHGRWIDATHGADHIREEIAAMLKASPEPMAEEWAIHDYESLPNMGENPDLDQVATLAEALAEADHPAALRAYIDNAGNYDPSGFEDAFRGQWDSLQDYVENFWEESGWLGEADKAAAGQWWHPARFIDWEQMAHELEISGDVWTAEAPDRGIYVFNNF